MCTRRRACVNYNGNKHKTNTRRLGKSGLYLIIFFILLQYSSHSYTVYCAFNLRHEQFSPVCCHQSRQVYKRWCDTSSAQSHHAVSQCFLLLVFLTFHGKLMDGLTLCKQLVLRPQLRYCMNSFGFDVD